MSGKDGRGRGRPAGRERTVLVALSGARHRAPAPVPLPLPLPPPRLRRGGKTPRSAEGRTVRVAIVFTAAATRTARIAYRQQQLAPERVQRRQPVSMCTHTRSHKSATLSACV
jgi:hypothetical protein